MTEGAVPVGTVGTVGERLPGVLARTAAVLLSAAAVLVAVWLFVRFGSGNMVRIASPDMHWHVDFDTFWRSSVALRAGGDLYDTGAELPNLNPPLLAVLLAPLASLEVLPAYHLFALVNLVLIVGCVVVVADEVRLPPAPAMLATAAVLLSSPLQSTIALGQIYGLLTAALTLGWWADRRGRQVLAGVAIGLAVAMKPSLLPLLAWPLLRPRTSTPTGGPRASWPMLVAALIAGAVGTGIGVLAAGTAATLDWLRELAATKPDGFLDNDSLAALAARFDQPVWLGYAAAAALLALTLARARRRPDTALWAITAASLLLAPIAWNTYLVLLAPVAAFLLGRGRTAAALPLMTLPLIGIEWSELLVEDSFLTRLGMSLYCGMLLVHWCVLVCGPPADGPNGDDRTAPVTVTECRRSSSSVPESPPAALPAESTTVPATDSAQPSRPG